MNEKLTEKAKAPVKKSTSTRIPEQIKEEFEGMSGFSFDDVRVHYNSEKPAQLQALAYTQGSEVHIAPGQEKHLNHELGHVIQQKRGAVKATSESGGKKINDSAALEKDADQIANDITASANNTLKAQPQEMNTGIGAGVYQFITAIPTHPKSHTTSDGEIGLPATSKSDNTAKPDVKPAGDNATSDEKGKTTIAAPELPPSQGTPLSQDKTSSHTSQSLPKLPLTEEPDAGAFAQLKTEVDKLNADFDAQKSTTDKAMGAAVTVLTGVKVNDAESIKKDKKIIEHVKKEHDQETATSETLPQVRQNATQRISTLNYIKDDFDIHTDFVNKLQKIKQTKDSVGTVQTPSEDFINQAAKRFTNGTKKMRIAYNGALKVEQKAGEESNTFAPGFKKDQAYYEPGKKQIFMDLDGDTETGSSGSTMSKRHGGAAIAFHELGHYIDLNSFPDLWYDKAELKKHLDSDFDEYKKKRQTDGTVDGKFKVETQLGIEYYIDKALIDIKFDDVSDIVHGLSSILAEKQKKPAPPPATTPPSPPATTPPSPPPATPPPSTTTSPTPPPTTTPPAPPPATTPPAPPTVTQPPPAKTPPTPPKPLVPEDRPSVGAFGHFGADYWNKNDAVEKETVAHMLESGFEELKKGAFKEVFPRSYEYLKAQFRLAVEPKTDATKKSQFQAASEWLKRTKKDR